MDQKDGYESLTLEDQRLLLSLAADGLAMARWLTDAERVRIRDILCRLLVANDPPKNG